jgi:general secretion pathway protein D
MIRSSLSYRKVDMATCFYQPYIQMPQKSQTGLSFMLLRSLAIFLLLFSFPMVQAADQEPSVTLNLNDVDIRAFIATVSESTGQNFIIDPRVKGKVTVVSAKPVPADRLYEVFLSVLKVHGFAAVPSGDAIKIIPDVAAKQDTIPTISEPDEHHSDKLITRVVQINHSDAAQLVPILRPLLAKQAHLAAHPNSNTLIITDSSTNADRIEQIIHRIDQANNRDIEVIQLRYSLASELSTTLHSLIEVTPSKGKSADKAPTLIADDRTNSLILSGDSSWRRNIRLLIAQLDAPISNEDNTEVIYLQHATATELMEVLKGVGDQQLEAQKKSKKAKAKDSRFDIRADEATNALVVTAPPFLMRSLKSVIGKLDIRRAQVQIEAIIAELRNDKAVELGIEWQSKTRDTGTVAGTNLPLTSAVGSSILSYPSTVGSGISLGYFRGGDLRALVRAFASDGDTNILSTPSLVTLDNEEASIHVGQNVPFVTGQYTSGDSNGGENPFQTIERHDVGIKLNITPHINEGDTIKLKIEQEVSSVDTKSDVDGLVTNKSIIQTTILVDDEEVIVLGGLMQDSLTENLSKVPLLGDVPLLGSLFQSRRTAFEKKNLMVFLRPQIIRDRADNTRLTGKKYTQIRQLQQGEQNKGISLMPKEQSPVLPKLDGSKEEALDITEDQDDPFSNPFLQQAY